MTPKAHHYQLIADVFAAGVAVESALPGIAKKLGVTEESCRAVLRSSWGQQQLQTYHAAVRQKLVERKLGAADQLVAVADRAAEVLNLAMETAVENKNVREMRETAVALLAHAGLGPVKRSEKKVAHEILLSNDPVLLARVIENNGDVPIELLEDRTKH